MKPARSSYSIQTPGAFTRRHVHSEFNGPWEAFTPDERRKFIDTVYTNADFSGIEVVAISVGLREFDLIFDVPSEPLELSRDEMLVRLRTYQKNFTGLTDANPFDEENEADWDRLKKRFADLGYFMKLLKQLCTRRYHAVHNTSGTIWAARYLDMYVQEGLHSQTLAAWMDYSGVRSGEGTDPSANPYATFGLACGGDRRARKMIRSLFGGGETWASARKQYEEFIADTTPPPGKPRRTNSGHAPLLDRQAILTANVPHFRGGLVFGDEEFCAQFVKENSAHFPESRLVPGRPIAGQNDPRLCTVRQKRDLRKPPKS